jgi:putative Holliday junction resolvase
VPKRPYRRKPRRPGAKLIGLDLGERRIGVAISDDTGVIASPDRIIDLRHGSLHDIAALVVDVNATGIVVGLPKGMLGDEGHQARAARDQAAELEQLVTTPIIFWDERLTSAIADRALEQSGMRSRERRDKRDAIAAAIMLQSYLDANPLVSDE